MNFLLLLVSTLPVVVIGWFIWRRDSEREPFRLLLKLFIGGLISTLIALALTFILYRIFPFFAQPHGNLNLAALFISVFIGVALVEEVSKWLITYFIAFRHQAYDHKYDGIVYAAFVSLGFALFENILYVMQWGMIVGLVRAVLTVPGHAAYGISMGYYLDLAKTGSLNKDKAQVRKNLIMSILEPTILHGIFDYCLFAGSGFFILLFFIFVILFFGFTWKRIKKASANQVALRPKTEEPIPATEETSDEMASEKIEVDEN